MRRKNTQGKGGKEKPITFKSKSIKIYRTVNRLYRTNPETGEKELKSEHPQFTLSYYLGKKRILRKFASEEEARLEGELAKTKIENNDTAVLDLSGGDRWTYVEATDNLRKAGFPDLTGDSLLLAINQYIEARKLLPAGVSLCDAVREHVNRTSSIRESRMIPELVEEFIELKAKADVSDAYMNTLIRLRKFSKAFNLPVHELTGAMLQDFMNNLGSPRTQLNYWRLVGAMLRYAVKRRYVGRDLLDELDSVQLPKLKPSKTEIFTPDELREMFKHTREHLIPWIAIAAFTGIRTAEILRLDWKDVHLDRKFIEVTAQNAKTAARRIVPLCDAGIAWLRPFAQEQGRVAYFSEENKFYTAVIYDVNSAQRKAKTKQKFKWKRNGLRHSFCSYRLAEIQNVAQVALEAGNSPNMIFKHYRELVTKDQAQQWFAVSPTDAAENVVSLQKSA